MEDAYDLSSFEYFKNRPLTGCIDSLSGVLNRDGLEGYIRWLVENERKFSVLLVDIDNFKNVNDTFGHLVGDIVIQQTAKRFVRLAGDKAVVARFGGDEFILICDGMTEYNDVWKFAHDAIFMQEGKIYYENLPNISLTITAGIARYPIDAGTYEEVFALADKALYRGKTKGRNCFIIYLPEKHAHLNLQGERDKRVKLMQQTIAIFSGLTACGKDVTVGVANTFKWLVLNYMFDHICLESPKKINHSVVFKLSTRKYFAHIPVSEIASICGGAPFVSLNSTDEITNDSFTSLKERFHRQNIYSTLFCKVAAYGVEYGYIRVDTTNTARVWQNEEVSTVLVAANALGLILYYQGKTLDDLPDVPPIEVENSI